jgi:hypothetical protein
LIVGNDYCYLVTAVTTNGIESCISNVDCAHLNFEIPILTHVSINSTANGTGTDTVKWSYPKELNTTIFPGPYHYQLYRETGYPSGTDALILTTTQQASIINPDTTYEDSSLDTENFIYLLNTNT